MPLKAATILAVHQGRVELSAEIVDGARDATDALVEAVRARIVEHQTEIMTDATILDPDSLSVASAFISRDPLGAAHHDGLARLGLSTAMTDGGNREEGSIFGRLGGKNRRSQLDRWVTPYLRARDITPRLAAFEGVFVDELTFGELTDEDVVEEGAALTVQAARSAFGAGISPGPEGIAALDEAILRDRATKQGRWVLSPACVLGLAAFVGESIRSMAPGSRWSDDSEGPLHIQVKGGVVVASDPTVRVIDLVLRGRQARLGEYAETVVRQSLTSGART